ncbi:hypothetical protein Tco_1154643 [Tanacetum coccineum]
MTPVSLSSGLVPNPSPSTPFVPPSRSDWDLLFQPMFDESLNVDFHAPEVIAPIPEAVAPEHAVSTGSPSSTTVDQDAPSPSTSHTTQGTQTPIISHDVEEDNHDIEVAHMGNDPYFGIPIPEVPSDQSSSDVIHTIVHPDHQVSEHTSKWTKDHPLENIIGALDRPVSTRLQLHEQALFCYYDAFLTSFLDKKILRSESLPHTTNAKPRHKFIYKTPSIRNENDKGDVKFIEKDETQPIPIMPNPNPIMFNSPTMSPFLKDCTVHIPYTQGLTKENVFEHDEMSNHVGDEELNLIDGVGIGKMKKEIKKEIERNDIGLTKEPNKEWKWNEKTVPHNENVYHYQWHPNEISHLKRIIKES